MTSTEPSQYGEHYYANYFGDRAYTVDDPAWPAFFGSVADLIVTDIKPTTTLDVGCAFGFLVNELRNRGVDAKGFDFSEHAIGQAAQLDPDLPDSVWVASAAEPFDGPYDLITCIEVIEHLGEEDARKALEHITNATDTLLLSSTPGDFAEPTHINVRPVEYWAEVLAELGFHRDHDLDVSRIAPWATLFRRSSPSTRDLVREYERSRFRLQTETSELRNEVVRLQGVDEQRHGEITDLSAQLEAERTAGSGQNETIDELQRERAELQAQIVELRQDLLRSNGAAVTAKAEAGEAKAELHLHLTELHHLQLYHDQIEERMTGLVNHAHIAEAELTAVKNSTSWRLTWWLLGPYRAVKTRVLGHG